jgi:hypothetical protein
MPKNMHHFNDTPHQKPSDKTSSICVFLLERKAKTVSFMSIVELIKFVIYTDHQEKLGYWKLGGQDGLAMWLITRWGK